MGEAARPGGCGGPARWVRPPAGPVPAAQGDPRARSAPPGALSEDEDEDDDSDDDSEEDSSESDSEDSRERGAALDG